MSLQNKTIAFNFLIALFCGMNGTQLGGVILFFVGVLLASIAPFGENVVLLLSGMILGFLGFVIVLISVIVERYKALKEGDLK